MPPIFCLQLDKIGATAALFIALELLNEYFYALPREMDAHLRSNRTREELEEFACENADVRRHLEAQRRKEALEEAVRLLDSVERDTAYQEKLQQKGR
jgi:tRNA(Ile)-lysidine synthase TilS/MesJ